MVWSLIRLDQPDVELLGAAQQLLDFALEIE